MFGCYTLWYRGVGKMENSLKEKNNGKGIIIAILIVLLLAACGFICYDKLLKKEESVSKKCNCPTCEKCDNNSNQGNKLKECTLDMNGKVNIDVNDVCSNAMEDGYDGVIVKNIKVNGKIYELKYVFEPGKDINENDTTSYYGNSVTKLYINDKLLDAYPGQDRNALMTLKVNNNKLILGETFPSDVPPTEHTYDLSDFD